jgi:hypothetical protein
MGGPIYSELAQLPDVPTPSASKYLKRNATDDGYEWADAGTSDHGGLSGLDDDDHTQYALADASRGDFLPLAGGTMTGALLLPNGAVGAPSLAFSTETTSGVYFDTGVSPSSVAIAVDSTRVGYFNDFLVRFHKPLTLDSSSNLTLTSGDLLLSGGVIDLTGSSTTTTLAELNSPASFTGYMLDAKNSAGTSVFIVDVYGNTLGDSYRGNGAYPFRWGSTSPQVGNAASTQWEMSWMDYGYLSTAFIRFSSKPTAAEGAAVWIKNPTTNSQVVLTLEGHATQSGDYLLVKQDDDTALVQINSSGQLLVTDGLATAPAIAFASASGTTGIYSDAAGRIRIGHNNATYGFSGLWALSREVYIMKDNATQWANNQWYVTQLFRAGANLTLAGGELSITEDTPANVPLTVKGAASQSGRLLETQSSVAAVLPAEIDASGYVSGLRYGGISVTGGAAATSLTTQNQWYQILSFTADDSAAGVTPDHTNDHLTIDTTGVYLVTLSIAFSGSASQNYEVQVQKNNGGTALTNLTLSRTLGAGGDVGSASISGLASLTAADTLEVWVRCTTGASKSVTVQEANLAVVRFD